MSIKGRRVVTGFNKDGKSCIKWDKEIEPINLRPGFENIPMWATRKLPAETTEEDPNTWDLGTSLAGGSGVVPLWALRAEERRALAQDRFGRLCDLYIRGDVDGNGRRRGPSETRR